MRYPFVIFFVLSFLTSVSFGATYTVNSTNDVNDGTCDGTHCSLREAINAANASGGADVIDFSASGIITLTLALPSITEAVTIDGYAGAPGGAAVNTNATGALNGTLTIVLDGATNSITTGLTLASSGSIIKGLVFNGFGDGTPSSNDIAINITSGSNQVLGCYIGTDALGTTAGGRTFWGIQIDNCGSNSIGDGTAAARNLISGLANTAQSTGIRITGASATNNLILGNIIGLQVGGALEFDNSTKWGIHVLSSAASNTIGGTAAGEGNVISGNDDMGIYSQSTNGNTIIGNIIGPQADGSTNVTGNEQAIGIGLSSSSNNSIGTGVSGARNVISANISAGVFVDGGSGNVIKGNYIGLASDGQTIITGSSQTAGVSLIATTSSNTVGGTGADEGNLISGNVTGISIGTLFTPSLGQNTVICNIIGPQNDGNTFVTGNTQTTGISINSSADNIIGSTAGAQQVISANQSAGVAIVSSGATGNVVKGNYIGIASNGTTIITDAEQEWGVGISFCNNNTIGGTLAGEGNVISGNADGVASDVSGILLSSALAGNTIIGNIIGPQANGTSHLASSAQTHGIRLFNTPGATIGGSTSDHRNIISGNDTYGIYMTRNNTTGNTISGNYIGPASDGSALTGSALEQDYGVYIIRTAAVNGPSQNTIGGRTGAAGTNPEGNLIAHNGVDGVYITHGTSTANLVTRNNIYSNGTKAINLNGTGNANKSKPVINSTFTATTVTGTAQANDTIEVFKNSSGGGPSCQNALVYLGSTQADGSGNWTFSPGGTILNSGETPTATATSTTNNTSEFGCPVWVGLPIELVYFKAEQINESSVKTYWRTASEINNDYFTVEVSSGSSDYGEEKIGGDTWSVVGTVPGAGNSSLVQDYLLTDYSPPFERGNKWVYYRLKQTDFDGSYKYSAIVPVYLKGISLFDIKISPNPTGDGNVNLFLSGKKGDNVVILIRDILGKEIYSKIYVLDNEEFAVTIRDEASLVPGLYTITASDNTNVLNRKIIIE